MWFLYIVHTAITIPGAVTPMAGRFEGSDDATIFRHSRITRKRRRNKENRVIIKCLDLALIKEKKERYEIL